MKFVKLTGLIVLGMLSIDAYSLDKSNYLESLDAEAEGLSLDGSTQKTINTAFLEVKQSSINVTRFGVLGAAGTSFIEGMSFKQFGGALKENFMGSFYYYKQLTSQQKESVYLAYQKFPELDMVRTSILRAK